MLELWRLLFQHKKYGSGKDGDIFISEPVSLTRDMEYRTLKCAEGVVLNLNGYTIKVLLNEVS